MIDDIPIDNSDKPVEVETVTEDQQVAEVVEPKKSRGRPKGTVKKKRKNPKRNLNRKRYQNLRYKHMNTRMNRSLMKKLSQCMIQEQLLQR